ncbi:hypothetical protein B0H14DRAFT_3716680, partial [Mycena olivaceomarginata]
MPRQSTVTEIRLNNIKGCLTPALTLLKELNDAFGPPFIQSIANTIESLINIIQNVKRNKDECAQLMEDIHPVLYAIINLHLKAETVESLSPEMLNNIGKFMETLHKIYTFLEGQQDGNRIKYLFRNNEVQKLFRDCHAGLDQAVEVFEVITRPLWVNDIDVIKKTAQLMHEELFELIQTLSDSSTNSNGSSVYEGGNESKNSSTSFSMLPSKPKIFYGRQSEVETIMKMLNKESPKIAILGGGGMGKTSLAKVILHYPQTLEKFQHRFFVSAEAATTSIELAALIGLHVGLTPGTDLTRPVVQYLSQKPSCLLILDNLETVWEPIQSRDGIEEFLSLLTEVQHLALLITMRGAERPGKVHWTHPFLLPLQPLSAEAAQQTFMDITDNAYKKEDMEQILQFTDNMPLAVDLIAHLADYEGLSNVLARWQTERTSLLTLAYQDGNRRLRSLMPMREHVQKFLPPSLPLVQCLRKQFNGLLELYQKYNGEQLGPVINQITLNLANFHQVLQQGLYNHAPDLGITIHSISSLNSFYRLTGRVCLNISTTLFLSANSVVQQGLIFYSADWIHAKLCNSTKKHWNCQSRVEIKMSSLKYRTGDYCTAQAHIAKALQLSRSAPNLFQEANALYIGAVCSTYLGNFWEAMDNLHRGRILLGICGLAGGNIDHQMANQQGEIHFLKSEYTQARSIYSQIVATVSPDQNAYVHAISLLNMAQSDTVCGDMRDVYHKLNQAKEILHKWIHSREIIACTMVEADIELREKKFELAKFGMAIQMASDILGKCLQNKNKLSLHKALLYLGDVFIVNQDGKTAENLYMLVQEGFTQMDIHCSRAQCMIRLGDLANEQGHTSKAISLWQTARPLFEQSLQAIDVAQIDVRLSATKKHDQEALTTLTAPDQQLNTGSSEIQQVESAHLEGSEGVVSALMPC